LKNRNFFGIELRYGSESMNKKLHELGEKEFDYLFPRGVIRLFLFNHDHYSFQDKDFGCVIEIFQTEIAYQELNSRRDGFMFLFSSALPSPEQDCIHFSASFISRFTLSSFTNASGGSMRE
ncbi:MAG: hypothetical protein WCR46_20935, partial [Deltaproteobacteria bacterium]